MHDAITEHLRDFVVWMADGGWQMTDADREASAVKDLPDDPERAYQAGHNAACESIVTAYELYCEQADG